MKEIFRGRKVAIVHPAWQACGSYQVFVGQLEAWRALGAETVSIACSDQPAFTPHRRWIWASYVRATPELDQAPRAFAGAPLSRLGSPAFLNGVLWPYLHGDHAAIRYGLAERSDIDPRIENETYDLVHCNHFFCMPVAERLAKGAPIMLESHDVQARQYVVQNKGAPWLKPHAAYEDMLRLELATMRRADLLLHLNAQEDKFFREILPEKPQALFYPAVSEVPMGPGGDEVIVVSSRNRANVESIIWFLREVAPHLRTPFRIYGSVERGVRARDRALYEKHRHAFAGRIKDLGPVYARAKLAILPTIEGTGISIKTIEAMASGLPLAATPLAFRGMSVDAAALDNVVIEEDPQKFAAAADAIAARPIATQQQRATSATRAIYDAHFSQPAYAQHLAKLAEPLLTKR